MLLLPVPLRIFFFFFFFVAAMGLHCTRGLSLVAARGLLIAVASLVVEHRL